jgi:hypothetical protein
VEYFREPPAASRQTISNQPVEEEEKIVSGGPKKALPVENFCSTWNKSLLYPIRVFIINGKMFHVERHQTLRNLTLYPG